MVVGVSADKNTLFIGIVDHGAMDTKPELPSEAVKLLDKKLIGGGFVDMAAIWDYLGKEAADPKSFLLAPVDLDEPIINIVKSLFDAELSIPFIKVWVPEVETSFLELTLVDVPREKRLFPKLLSAMEALGLTSGGRNEEENKDEEED